MKQFKKHRNVANKTIEAWGEYWLPLIWTDHFNLEDLIVNIIPNDSDFVSEINIYKNDINIQDYYVERLALEFIALSMWKEIAKWLFQISYNFNKTYKTYLTKLNMVDIKICVDSEDNEAILFIDLTNYKYSFDDEKSEYISFSNSFKCDKMLSMKIKEFL